MRFFLLDKFQFFVKNGLNMDKIILQFLNTNNIFYQLLEHDPIFTMQQTTAIDGITLEEGMKSLLLKANNNYYLCVLPGHKKLDSKKLKQLLCTRDLRFATAEEVKEIMKCEVGSCYPFGNLLPINMILEASIGENRFVSFTPGVHNKSIKMRWKDYAKIVRPNIQHIAQ